MKGKGRADHGPEERRMGPNERGWLERMADIGFDYTKSLEENAREAKESRGPSGARS